MSANLTPSQTIGPFFHEATCWLVDDSPAPNDWISIQGCVLDADGKPVGDAMLEISLGAGAHFQRTFSAQDGSFRFGLPPGGIAHVTVFARGLLRHLFTRVYLDVAQVPAAVPAERRGTLVAVPAGNCHHWNLRLRGPGETVFFDLE